MEAPWINVYKPKEWALHEVLVPSSARTAFEEVLDSIDDCTKDSRVKIIGAESELARLWWETGHSWVERVIFYDLEQLWSMGFDTVYGVAECGFLTQEWKGHPKGSFAMALCKGVNEEPRFFTIAVAKNFSLK